MNAPSRAPSTARNDLAVEPLAPVLALDRRGRLGLTLGLAVALVVHSAGGKGVLHALPHLAQLAHDIREDVHGRLHAQVDIDLTPPPPPPPPPPEPEPEKEPPPPAHTRAAAPPPGAPPPPAAEAGKVLTAEADPDEPVDLTGDGFVSGAGDRFAGGVTASAGTAKNAVRSAAATPTGTGTAPRAVAAPAPSVDRSRLPSPGSVDWQSCGFPPAADQDNVNLAKVQVALTVTAAGRVKSVVVLSESPAGYGFGALAKRCAMTKVFDPPLDSAGKPAERSMPPFVIKFWR